ncbi:MAG: hypothetical protein RIQ72_185 [Candidatus Parcubacteria bacterium]|jgi:hypothetical protein
MGHRAPFFFIFKALLYSQSYILKMALNALNCMANNKVYLLNKEFDKVNVMRIIATTQYRYAK